MTYIHTHIVSVPAVPAQLWLSVAGLLRESQQGGLAVLLQHEKVGEPEFLRKTLGVLTWGVLTWGVFWGWNVGTGSNTYWTDLFSGPCYTISHRIHVWYIW